MIFGFKKRSPSGHEISGRTADGFLKKVKIGAEVSENELKIKINERRRELKERLDEIDRLLNSFSDILPKGREMEFMLQIEAARKLVERDDISAERLGELIEFMDMVLEQMKGKI